jgi:hypothetical protein
MRWVLAAVFVCFLGGSGAWAEPKNESLWELAQRHRDVHRFSTLFPAQSVRDKLSDDAGTDAAIDWCKRTGITKVYIETFRNGYQAEDATLRRAKERLTQAGFDVSGCVTPTTFGKRSSGPKDHRVCYTDLPTQRRAREIFAFAASIFDEVMIDDFWSTDCECPECDAARRAKTVTVGDRTLQAPGDSWGEYRRMLMRQVSRACVLEPNPKTRFILKYPNWYDDYHVRGYDVIGQTADFPMIWVGNETRDIDNPMHPGIPQYAGYFIQRWLGGIAGEKCGGGWYDPHHTSPPVYIEQARQTILGRARESVLFSYRSLHEQEHGPANVEALRAAMPELFDVAAEVRKRKPIGIAAYKPPYSGEDRSDFHVFDFAGMIGLPLAPCHEFPADAPAALFATYALADPDFVRKLSEYIASGRPVLLTHTLAERVKDDLKLAAPNVHVLTYESRARSMLKLSRETLRTLREPMLAPLNVRFDASAGVALYLFADGSWVAENFNDADVEVTVNGEKAIIPARQWRLRWSGRA